MRRLGALPAGADHALNPDSTPVAIYYSADDKSGGGRCRENPIRTWNVVSGALTPDPAATAASALAWASLVMDRGETPGSLRV